MKLTIDNISAFVNLVHFGNYQNAAASLKVTQPALTRRIQRLEDALGAKLIDRRYRGVSLTALGTNYLPIALRMVNDFNRSNQQTKDLVLARTGTVKVSMNMTMATTVLPNILSVFSELHPQVSVQITEDSVFSLSKKFSRERLSLALRHSQPQSRRSILKNVTLIRSCLWLTRIMNCKAKH